jgi:hypothetical protein
MLGTETVRALRAKASKYDLWSFGSDIEQSFISAEQIVSYWYSL